jgi:nitroreductase
MLTQAFDVLNHAHHHKKKQQNDSDQPNRDIIALVFCSSGGYSVGKWETEMNRLTENAPAVSDAINTRFSCRAFLDKPVAEEDVKYIVETAMRAPSGGNLQPWNVHILQGEARDKLVATVAEKGQEKPMGEGSEYHIYPPELKEPYNGRRFEIGERMYEIMGVAREDKAARLAWLASNFTFFNAPIGMFFSLDKQMQEGQWSDMGMLIQTMMLLARERGLHTCPQEAWAIWAPTVKEYLNIPDTHTLFCGLALGYADPNAAVNNLESPRAPMGEVATYLGF